MHAGLKPYSCGKCNKSFTLKSVLTRHVRIHTGYRPFKCSACGKSFFQKKDLAGHMLHAGKCICRFGGIYAYCRYFIDRKW